MPDTVDVFVPEAQAPAPVNQGAFVESLKRNNSKIRQDRAEAIAEDAQVMYKRKVEDLSIAISRMKRERDNMLDLSPVATTSLVLASDFDGNNFVEKDLELGIKIRQKEIEYDVAKSRYIFLFGNA